jgi:hypothetical protein
MSDDDVVRFKPKRKLEQLSRADLKGLTPEEITKARELGHLDVLLGRQSPEPPGPPAPNPNTAAIMKKLAEDLEKGRG